jgi:urease beta subunit
MKTKLIVAFLIINFTLFSQNVAINATGAAPNASSILDLASTSQGFLTPRMTQAQRLAIAIPATGLLVYQTNLVNGFYYYDGAAWILIAGSGSVTASNGLNLVGSDVRLGGTLTQNTIITQPTTFSFRLNNTGTANTIFDLQSTGDLDIQAASTTFFKAANTGNVAITSTGAAPNTSAILDLVSTTRGFLTPRMNQAQRLAIATPATGLIVYQTNLTTGFYYYDGTVWVYMSPTGTGLATASNGLNAVGTDVRLGGTLTQSTTITQPTTFSFRLNNTGTANTIFDLQSTGDLDIQAGSTTFFKAANTGNVAITTTGAVPNASSMLDLVSTTRGFLTPRMTQAQRLAIATPATGLLVYQTNLTTGFYYYDGTAWVYMSPTGTGLTTASNGLNAVGTDVRLGGTLTQNTTITQPTAFSFRLNNTGTANTIFDLQSTGDLDIQAGSTTFFKAANTGNVAITNTGAVPNVSSMLDLVSTTRGFLTPRMTQAQRIAIVTPATGLLVYQTNLTTGFYYYDGAAWVYMSPTGSGLATASNGLNAAGTDVRLGGTLTQNTTITQPTAFNFRINNTGTANTIFDMQSTGDFEVQTSSTSALHVANSGFVGINNNTPAFDLDVNGEIRTGRNGTDGSLYIYSEQGATDYVYNIQPNVAATQNVNLQLPPDDGNSGQVLTTNGAGILSWTNNTQWNITGNAGTASATNFLGTTDDIGLTFRVNNEKAGFIGNSTNYNTFFGHLSGFSATTGDGNTGIGKNALGGNATGTGNTAIGNGAAISNAVGNSNVAVGESALLNNQSTGRNVAVGASALQSFSFNNGGVAYNTHNVAIGRASLATLNGTSNANAQDNVAVGAVSGVNASTNVGCTYIGTSTSDAAPGYVNGTVLGYNCTLDASNRVRLGGSGVTSVGGPVAYTNFSDQRFKFNTSENLMGVEFVKRLRPILYQFDYKKLDDFYNRPDSLRKNIDYNNANNLKQVGFNAQEIESLCKELGFDFGAVDKPQDTSKGIYGIRYSNFIPVLVKAIQEQQIQLEEDRKLIILLQQEIEKIKK